MNWIYMKRKDILELPVSISSWIILRDYALHHADLLVYEKLLREYWDVCPAFELENILTIARISLEEDEFQHLASLLSEC